MSQTLRTRQERFQCAGLYADSEIDWFFFDGGKKRPPQPVDARLKNWNTQITASWLITSWGARDPHRHNNWRVVKARADLRDAWCEMALSKAGITKPPSAP